MSAFIQQCPRCGLSIPPAARYCPACGNALVAAPAPYAPPLSAYSVTNTHTIGFLVVAVLLSFLWFRINGVGVFPLGFVGTLLIAWWSQDIDRHFGRPSQFVVTVLLGLVGVFVGFFL